MRKRLIVILFILALLALGTIEAGNGWGSTRSCRRGKVENKKHCQIVLVEDINVQTYGLG